MVFLFCFVFGGVFWRRISSTMEKVRNIFHLMTYSLSNKLLALFFFFPKGDLLNYFGGRLSKIAGLVSVLNHSSADVERRLV